MQIGRWAIAIALLVGPMAAAPALAKSDKSEGHRKGPKWEHSGEGPESDVHVSVGIRIGDDDRRIIRSYYADHPYRPEALPPGIAKNLARGKPLPPGIAKRYMPHELVGRLPHRPNCDWLVVGAHAVLFDRTTGIVVDIAADIFL